MDWRPELYAATLLLGVHHTSNFDTPATQPVWTDVSAGLTDLTLWEFALDPFEPSKYQYVMDNSTAVGEHELWRRANGGNWTSILTVAQACAALGVGSTMGYLLGFCTDPVTVGRLWALYGRYGYAGNPDGGERWALYSDNRGDSWTGVNRIHWSELCNSINPVAEWTMRARGNNIWASFEMDISPEWGNDSHFVVAYSSDKGANWNYVVHNPVGVTSAMPLALNPLETDRVYTWAGLTANTGQVIQVKNDGTIVTLSGLTDGVIPLLSQSLWFDPDDVNHQRLIRWEYLFSTTDKWATNVASGNSFSRLRSVSPWCGPVKDNMFVGCLPIANNASYPHTVATLVGENPAAFTGISGAMAHAAPYTNSIPSTCGGLCTNGLGVVGPGAPFLNVYDVLFGVGGVGSIPFDGDGIGSVVYG